MPDVVSLDRIRKGLGSTRPIRPEETGRVTFRVIIDGFNVPLTRPWQGSDVLPRYVRPAHPLYHHEFLQMVTPEAFRAGVLYPGVDLLSLARALAGDTGRGTRRREAAVRRQIREELRRLIEAQTKAKVP